FASLAEKKKIDFTYHLPVKKLVTWFDPDKLEKILNNLLSNAFKFTSEGGKIKITVSLVPAKNKKSTLTDKNTLLLTIEDTGRGIPKDQLEKIFDRFHQVENAKTPETVGTGIGLSLTKELIDLMLGEIKVESQSGKGTTFFVWLPLGKEHLSEWNFTIREARPDPLKKIPEAGEVIEEEKYTEDVSQDEPLEYDLPLVLTVEDHEDIRTHIRENLEGSFRVMEAGDGLTGLDKAIENIPDMIITDLMMPGMDGIELCKKLKTDERTSHIPVIMLTAKASVEDKLEGLETGADAYIVKPFSIKELRLRVSKLIEQRKILRERYSKEVTLEPGDIAVTSADERFLQKTLACIEEHMGDSDFDVRQFQDEMSMSRMQLFRKLKALVGYTPSEFIRNLRLKRAAKLLDQDYGNVAEVCYEVGFNNLSYFAKCFKELFGVLPSEYLKNEKRS
ncbi:MAG: response regulator, partial [Bacteroidales bacterium]